MLAILAALLCGIIFGLGLIVSQMANPAKVLNFLDFFGAWDPSLAFAMGTDPGGGDRLRTRPPSRGAGIGANSICRGGMNWTRASSLAPPFSVSAGASLASARGQH